MTTNKYIELQRLIYGMTGTMPLLTKDYEELVREMELIRSSVEIKGFIFRQSFFNGKSLNDFTNADWKAMYHQYALTYGFSAYNIDEMNKLVKLSHEYQKVNGDFEYLPASDLDFDVRLDGMEYIREIVEDIADSKIVLREHQIQIVKETPVEILEQVFQNASFIVKEIEILFAQTLMSKNSQIEVFSTIDQTVRFVVAAYQIQEPRVEGQLNTETLKQVKLKIPTSARKRIIKRLNSGNPMNDAVQGKKYQQFIKRLIKQSMWMPLAQTKKKFKTFSRFTDLIYGTIPTARTQIEELKRAGNLREAFEIEMLNPGEAARSLLFYLRYREGEKFATKNRPNVAKRDKEKLETVLDSALRKTKSVIKKKILRTSLTQVDEVKTSAIETIISDRFDNFLLQCNNKLLWQLVALLEDDRYFSEIYERECNKVKVSYAKPLPKINRVHAEIVINKIKAAIKKKLVESNKALGKVYADASLEDTAIAFSGRESKEISVSGSFLAPGSKIDINDAINDPDKLIRLGVAWRGKTTDLDHTVNLCNTDRDCSYGNPTVRSGENDEVMMTSSGDITGCSSNIFSTELIDFDPRMLIEDGEKLLISSVNNYGNETHIKEYEAYAFFNIIDKSERVRAGTSMTIPLDAMQYAIRLNTESSTAINLMVDLENGKIQPINLPANDLPRFSNAANYKEDFLSAIKQRQNFITAATTIAGVIDSEQFVDSIEEADTIISAEKLKERLEPENEDKKFIAVNVDTIAIQDIVF